MSAKEGRRLDGRRPRTGRGGYPTGRLEVDEKDRRIIGELQRDGRVAFRKLGHALGLSTTTITSRVKGLEGRGVIGGYSVRVSSEALGYTLTAVTEVLVSKGKLLEMEREIARLPGVCAVYDVTGEIDGIVVAKFRDREELSRFTKGLMTMPFVERANTHVVLTTVKEDFRLPARPE